MKHRLLERLHADHVNMAAVMRVMDDEFDRLEAGGEADYALLEDALRYIAGYSDTHHHPLEDVVYDELGRAAPQVAGDLGRIVEQHEKLIRQGQELKAAIEAVEEAAIVRRDTLVAAGRAYIEALRKHMQIEEGTLFPTAAEHMSSEGWANVESHMQVPPDPLFGPKPEAEYQALLARLRD